jgi:hypothetical protein
LKSKTGVRLSVAAVGIFVAAYAVSPVFAARGLVSAAKSGDAAALERHVDFPVFRASLKEELGHRLMGELSGSKADRGLAALGMVYGKSIVEGAVDTLVTPGTIATMVREGEAPSARKVLEGGRKPEDKRDSRVRQSWSYRGLNSFAVTLTRDDKPNEQVALLMSRRNLFQWKLSGVDLSRPD